MLVSCMYILVARMYMLVARMYMLVSSMYMLVSCMYMLVSSMYILEAARSQADSCKYLSLKQEVCEQTYGCNLLSLLACQGSSELLCDGQEFCLRGLNVEEREGCWPLANHEVRHGLQPDVVWLRHEDILLFDCGALHPLHKCRWPVQHHIPALQT